MKLYVHIKGVSVRLNSSLISSKVQRRKLNHLLHVFNHFCLSCPFQSYDVCSWETAETDWYLRLDVQQRWPPPLRSAADRGSPSRWGSPPRSCPSSPPGGKRTPSQNASQSKSNFSSLWLCPRGSLIIHQQPLWKWGHGASSNHFIANQLFLVSSFLLESYTISSVSSGSQTLLSYTDDCIRAPSSKAFALSLDKLIKLLICQLRRLHTVGPLHFLPLTTRS